MALDAGLMLLGTGCGAGDTSDNTTDEGTEATSAVDDSAGEADDTDDAGDDDSGEETTGDDSSAGSGERPNGEAGSIDYTASLDATSVCLDVPADGVQVGAGDAAVSGGDPVEINVAGDRVSGSGVFAALDGSGGYEGTFEFVCG